ncbi:MAG: UDP-N-acetylglucosamine--N-acetylmuramyl-(pentapeptide) pyrophosphoryl-undecaprenol N-acetylglucosamine transferase [Clostridia bacterium]|nr:UDP-N-acetylglucosamine--N-acetylmuramyl-(pentapeptide) pyrophosphoryl-undecaprenol N-acetylglucosamine transferase [Clostridia bacterium]
MRIAFTGGGTAGHVNPAIAVADAIKRKCPDAEILFVGTPGGMENKLVTEAGYPIWHIDIGGLSRSLSPKNIGVLIKAARSLSEARRIINKFRPDAVFGTGGYVCYPLLREASKMGIFTAIHESNAVAGLAVKLLSGRVDRVYLNFDGARKELKAPERARTVGNPVRGEILRMDRESARYRLGIGHPIPGHESEFGSGRMPLGSYRHVTVSFGGSLGAETVNKVALRLMDSYGRTHPDTLMIHATGKSGYPDFMSKATELGVTSLRNVIINEFIYELPLWLSAADLVICRAGANTVSELAAVGRASILIPSPNVTGDHQYKNACVMGDAGGAFVVREREEELAKTEQLMGSILGDRRLREGMELCATKLSPSENAAEVIADEMLGNRS